MIRVIFAVALRQDIYRNNSQFNYQEAAQSIAAGNGFAINHEPVFSQAPGYSAYLALYYKLFSHNVAQSIAILLQLILSCLVPIFMYMLTFALTQSNGISWIAAWLSVLNTGFILQNLYSGPSGLALILFISFLFCYFKIGANWNWTILSAVLLSLFTYIEPLGVYIGIAALLFLFFTKNRYFKIAIFGLVFFASLTPWYIRNYSLTGYWFFLPLIESYLINNAAPYILSEVAHVTKDASQRYLNKAVKLACISKEMQYNKTKNNKKNSICAEKESFMIAFPWIWFYPHYFIKYIITQIGISLFDLHTGNIGTYNKANSWLKLLILIEFIYIRFLWILVLASCAILFSQKPLLATISGQKFLVLFAVSILFITGIFGNYAQRLYAEPLCIILAGIFWHYSIKELYAKNKNSSILNVDTIIEN